MFISGYYVLSRSDSQRWNLGSKSEHFKNSRYILSHCSLDKKYPSASLPVVYESEGETLFSPVLLELPILSLLIWDDSSLF